MQTGDGSYNEIGPNLIISEGGVLGYSSADLTVLPTNVWVRLTLESVLGSGSTFTLQMKPEGSPEQVYSGLPYDAAEFKILDNLTFLIKGSDSVYVDNMSIQKMED